MKEWHPTEIELAEASDAAAGEELADHLRWCSQCRGVAADYEWLDEGIAAAMDAGLEDVAVPKPAWERVHGSFEARQRVVGGGQVLAVAGAVAMTCLMLGTSSVLGGGMRGRGTVAPGLATAALPIAAPAQDRLTGESEGPALTMTPGRSARSADTVVSLPFVPPPEPPEPEA
jgi:hypothetical protein